MPVGRARPVAAWVSHFLVESVRAGREVRYRVVGAQLAATARRLEDVGAEWDRRLAAIKDIAESP